MTKEVTILIADDHSLVRGGLKQVLQQREEYTIIEANNGKDALAIIRKKKPDIAILDIEMPEISGLIVAEKVKREGIILDIIFLTMYNDFTMFNKAMEIGVKGYLLKENTVSEILTCVDVVLEGKSYVSPTLTDFLIQRNQKLFNRTTGKDGLQSLSPAELKIMQMLSELYTNQEMADDLSISIKTVQNHRNHISQKLNITGTHALLKYAVENKDRL